MAYTPQTWVDNNASYPLSAARMNTMESGISNAASVADQGHQILTTAQRDALTGVTAGTMIYNTTAQQMQIYIGTGWIPIGGSLVFTNEAARDAAITSPSEGMTAYLTAPTTPATSGASTSILPSGSMTIYNGSVWVCLTPVSAQQIANSSSITSTTYTNALWSAAPLTVTTVTGTTALIHISARIAAAGNYYFVGVKSATVAAQDQQALSMAIATQTSSGTSTFVMYGLTAGTNTFTVQMRSNAGAFTIDQVNLTVAGIA